MQNKKIIPAVITPFTDKFTIDFKSFEFHIREMFESGATDVIVFGTTGEGNSLAVAERFEAIDKLSGFQIDKDKIIIGTGCANILDTLTLSTGAIKKGFKNLLILPPFYYKNISGEGIISYFELLLGQLEEANVYLYHFPQMSGVAIDQNIIDELKKHHSNLKGMKDSTGDWESTFRFANDNKEMEIFAGNEKAFLRSLNRGCKGVVSATFNFQIDLAAKTLNAFMQKSDEMFELEKKLIENRKSLEALPIIPTMKYMLAKKYSIPTLEYVRPPLMELTDEQKSLADEIMSRM